MSALPSNLLSASSDAASAVRRRDVIQTIYLYVIDIFNSDNYRLKAPRSTFRINRRPGQCLMSIRNPNTECPTSTFPCSSHYCVIFHSADHRRNLRVANVAPYHIITICGQHRPRLLLDCSNVIQFYRYIHHTVGGLSMVRSSLEHLLWLNIRHVFLALIYFSINQTSLKLFLISL